MWPSNASSPDCVRDDLSATTVRTNEAIVHLAPMIEPFPMYEWMRGRVYDVYDLVAMIVRPQPRSLASGENDVAGQKSLVAKPVACDTSAAPSKAASLRR